MPSFKFLFFPLAFLALMPLTNLGFADEQSYTPPTDFYTSIDCSSTNAVSSLSNAIIVSLLQDRARRPSAPRFTYIIQKSPLQKGKIAGLCFVQQASITDRRPCAHTQLVLKSTDLTSDPVETQEDGSFQFENVPYKTLYLIEPVTTESYQVEFRDL
jgi:hypothetical protein